MARFAQQQFNDAPLHGRFGHHRCRIIQDGLAQIARKTMIYLVKMFIEEYHLGIKLIGSNLENWSQSFHLPCDASEAFIVALTYNGKTVIHFQIGSRDQILFAVPFCPTRKRPLKKEVICKLNLKDIRHVFTECAIDLLQSAGGKDANRAAEHLLNFVKNNGDTWN